MHSIDAGLDRDIAITHERFLRVMEERLPSMRLETKQRYFAVLSALVAKLEEREKGMRQVLTEVMSDVATHLFEELSGNG